MSKKIKTINLKSEDLLKAASMLKVLGHPIRIKIIELLVKYERMSVKTIHTALNTLQGTASFHLVKMVNYNLLKSEQVGRNIFYTVAHPKILQVVKLMLEIQKY